jgi:integrase
MWEGRYHVYVKLPDGSEKRRERTKVLGPIAAMSKPEAQQSLLRVIAVARGEARALPVMPTFQDVWTRYRSLKESSWSTVTKKTMVSIFEGGTHKKKRPSVLSMVGHWTMSDLTRDPLQECLNQLAARGDSFSAVKKVRTYLSAALDYALDERLIQVNPARKLELPTNWLKKPCGRFYSIDEVRKLLSIAASESLREHLIIRIFLVCGLRGQEMFVLRVDDLEPGILRIDEALKETEKGDARIGDTKSATSNGYVSISPELEKEIRTWLQLRRIADPYHRAAEPEPNDLLFPTEAGTPFRIGNYLKRTLKPLAKRAGIGDMTYQALRRTFATHFQRYGSPKDAQTQMRHSKLEMTGWYMKEIPASVRAAVEKMDADLSAPRHETHSDPKNSIQ